MEACVARYSERQRKIQRLVDDLEAAENEHRELTRRDFGLADGDTVSVPLLVTAVVSMVHAAQVAGKELS
jgi:hypothetical protein